MVKLLLVPHNVDVNYQDQHDWISLLSAVEGGHEEVLRLLFAQDGVNADSKTRMAGHRCFNVGFAGLTLSSVATGGGHEDVVQLLLTQDNVDVDSKDVFGQTPVFQRCRNET